MDALSVRLFKTDPLTALCRHSDQIFVSGFFRIESDCKECNAVAAGIDPNLVTFPETGRSTLEFRINGTLFTTQSGCLAFQCRGKTPGYGSLFSACGVNAGGQAENEQYAVK